MMDTETKGTIARLPGRWCWVMVLLLVLLTGVVTARMSGVKQGMVVTFHNSSQVVIESVQLDFGSADTQSRIQAFRIPPGDERQLLLNHEPGMGFNVAVHYRGGKEQTFCALHGDDRSDPVIYLQP
ncbi:hypothetical protein SAMN03080615_01407 [Amphritea atlantica]|uniref:EfeO-type cupredoxin-like domain-containing protein n=2 Tax=Amphritea atlantica TaxID=355243 RepID=A0A1H9FT66_9GAMM|nr:hypothetical protein [Amphritea atlantica]SEQ40688.1 hypothetical protein SAMN03080615_01407 [Amphritea atlantica]